MQKISRELIPRLIGAFVVAMGAWIAIKVLAHQNEKEWFISLNTIAQKHSQNANNWLQKKMQLAVELAEDPRLLALFDDRTNLQPARSVLYEFGQINFIDHVYIFDLDVVKVVAKRAGSPTLPDIAIDHLAIAHDEGWTRIVHTLGNGDKTQLLVASVIRGDLGEVIGYALYVEPLKKSIRDMEKALGRDSRVQLSLSRLNTARNASLMWDINHLSPIFRQVRLEEISIPLFDRNYENGVFTGPNKTKNLMAFADLEDKTNWRAIASIDRQFLIEDAQLTKRLIQIATGVVIALLLLTPGKGAYSQKLRSGFRIAFPSLLPTQKKEEKDKPFAPEITPVDIHHVRANQNPKEAPAKDIRKESPRAVPKNSGEKRTTGFVGEGRKEGFGTKAEDLKNLDKKPQIIIPRNKKFDKSDDEDRDHVTEFMIRQGIKNNQFKLVYQPIIDVNNGKPFMYEVLSRIIDEDGQVIPPNVWLPVVKRDNLFQDIDKGVINMALEEHILSGQLKTPLTFNISGNTFDSLNFIDDIKEKMEKRPDLAQYLLFELNSKEIIQDKKAMAFVKEHRALGFKFSIDYFGGGIDTIKAAKTLKFNFVKLDALKYDINDKADQKELIALIKTAQQVEIPIIVERIEDAKFFNFIKKVGAPYAQGYYLAEPSASISGDLVL